MQPVASIANVLSSAPLTTEPVEGDTLTKYLRSLLNQTGQLQGAFVNNGLSTESAGNGNLTDALRTLGSASGFWNPILGGQRAAMLNTLAPDVARINDQFNQIRQSQTMLNPRGGGRASTFVAAPYQQQAQIQQLYQGLRPQAAQSVQQIGAQEGQLSLQQLQQALAKYGLGLEAGQNAAQDQLARRGQNYETDAGNKSFASNLIGSMFGR